LVVSLLNEYLDGMVRIAFQHDGTLDKIVGDAITIIFSAPVAQPDHAARGVACALAMDSFAQAYAEAKRSEGIRLGKTRIGVNSGPVIIGNFGGDTVFDYTAHGDAINTAARMESVNKHLGTRVCISGFTVAGCPDFIGRPVGTLVLKGKTQGIEAFEPLTEAEAGSSAAAAYRAAFDLLERQDPDANKAFAALAANYPDDPLAALHLKRLRAGETGTTSVMAEK
jgi:adenylate cyclase